MNRDNLLWFCLGGVVAFVLLTQTRVIDPKPVPPQPVHDIIFDTPEPPLALTADELEGLSERERFLFKRFADVADRRAERALEVRGPGIVAKAIGQTIDEATAAAEGRKTAGGIWAALGAKLFQFVRVAVRAIYIAITVDVIQAYWYIFWPLVVAVISVVFWMNDWMAKLLGKKS